LKGATAPEAHWALRGITGKSGPANLTAKKAAGDIFFFAGCRVCAPTGVGPWLFQYIQFQLNSVRVVRSHRSRKEPVLQGFINCKSGNSYQGGGSEQIPLL
jgi:hypothetical protein